MEFAVHFHISDVIGYHVNKYGTSPPAIIETNNKTAAFYILCIDIPKNPKVFAWKTRTINVCGHAEDVERFTSTLDQKLKGRNLNISFIIYLSKFLVIHFFILHKISMCEDDNVIF